MRWKKLAVLGVVVACGLTMWGMLREQPETGIPVHTAEVGNRDLYHMLDLYGKLQPQRSYTIMSEVGGRVSELLVAQGDIVTQGQLLFALDTQALSAQREQIALQYDAEKLSLEAQRQQLQQQRLDSVAALAQGPGMALDDFVGGVRRYNGQQQQADSIEQEAIEARLELYQAQMKELDRQMASMRYYAPEDGRVLLADIQQDGLLAPGMAALVIGSTDAPHLIAQVSQHDMEQLTLGMQATVYIREKPVLAVIRNIAPTAVTTQSLQGVETVCMVTVELLEPVEAVMDTMAKATVTIRDALNCPCVPIESVVVEGKQAYVWVLMEDMTVQRLSVQQDIWDGFYIRTPELAAGQRVILNPSKDLAPGERVAPYD